MSIRPSAQELAVATEVSRNRATPPDMLTDNSLSRRAYPAARAKISPRMGSRPAPGLARHVRVREAWRVKLEQANVPEVRVRSPQGGIHC